jgi:hypothetical protein
VWRTKSPTWSVLRACTSATFTATLREKLQTRACRHPALPPRRFRMMSIMKVLMLLVALLGMACAAHAQGGEEASSGLAAFGRKLSTYGWYYPSHGYKSYGKKVRRDACLSAAADRPRLSARNCLLCLLIANCNEALVIKFGVQGKKSKGKKSKKVCCP